MSECKCLNNGQCTMNNNTSNYSCVCSDCTGGEFCENVYSYVQYSMSSSISIEILLQELPSTKIALKILFLFIFSLLTVLSFVNNLLTLSTCFANKIRITVCGLYIILFSFLSFVSTAFLEIMAIVALFFNNDLKEHSLIYCILLPTFLSFTYDLCIWLSAFIAVEHVLIQFSYNSLYRTRKYSVIFLVILFLFLGTGSVISAFGRSFGKNPVRSTYYVCSFHHFTNRNLEIAHEILGHIFLHFVIPLLIIFLSILLTLTRIIRRKISITDLERNSWLSLITQQILKHKVFFVPPLVNIVCALPEPVLLNIAVKYCIEKSMQRFYLRLHIALDFLLYMPLALTFFIYIYPSKVYMKVFHETEIVKWIKLKVLGRYSSTSSNIEEEDSEEQTYEETRL